MSDLMAWFDGLALWQQGLVVLAAVVTVLWGLALMEGVFGARARYWGGR